MNDTLTSDWNACVVSEAEERSRPAPKDNWPLMGDAFSSRGGVPELLIQWRRARGEDDPEPRL